MRKYQMQICVIAAVALLGTAAFCGFRIYHHYAQREKQTEVFKQMAELVENAPEESPKEDTPVSEGEDVLEKYKELALYDTGINAEYGDKLLTLSTCEYSAPNGRLVVVAKKVS